MTFTQLVPEVASRLRLWLEGIYLGNFELAAKSHLSEERIDEQVEVMQRYVPTMQPVVRILEIGMGFGAFLNLAHHKYGLQTFGVEPDTSALHCATRFAKINGLAPRPQCQSVGESLPFADAVFDIVYSTNVIEHVHDPEKVIYEAFRVLKPGGFLHFVIPNYGSVWDGHYALPWIPYAPKFIMKCCVRLLGRDPKYLDCLQLINIFTLRKILIRSPFELRVVSWGEEVFCDRLASVSFSEHAGMKGLAKLVRFTQKLHIVPFLQWLSRRFVLYTPFVLTVEKKYRVLSSAIST